ncbi:hypothetical protein CPC08DRAFT_632434 [Agrocybe pediades]|nr:hypothetical protein CPC08DRAFT_632434 [Agrocybe pediades]
MSAITALKKQLCKRCKKSKPADASNFQERRDGFSKTCLACLKGSNEGYARKKASNNKENPDHRPIQHDIRRDTDFDAPAVELDAFLDHLQSYATDTIELESTPVKLSSISLPQSESEMREAADNVAKAVGECLEYRFIYNKKYEYKTTSTRFEFSCAQNGSRQDKPKKGKAESGKMRNKGAMDTFECKGWLNVVVKRNHSTVLVSVKHLDRHFSYWCIDVPQDIRDFVEKNYALPMSQLWQEIIKQIPTPRFSYKSIYRLWSNHRSGKWKRDPSDEVNSAKILIEEASKQPKSIYSVEPIPLHDEEGFTAIAFALPDMLRQWGGRIREISLDSACKATFFLPKNLYALLGEVYGSGCPLGYLMIHSSNGDTGGKQRFISDLLNHFKKKWHVNALFTLTDKDFSEINAFREVFPEAKHQLCPTSKFYDVMEAKKEYKWIDESFIPIGQVKECDRDKVHGCDLYFIHMYIVTDY